MAGGQTGMGKSVYLAAFIVTAVIFALVFSFVRASEESQIDRLYSETTQLYEELQANKILNNYLSGENALLSDSNVCLIYERQISRQLNKIYDLFGQLERLDTGTFAVSKESVRRQYLLTSMSLWIDLQNTQRSCDLKIKPVLYFFPSTQDCVLCTAMQNQLEVLKQDCPQVRVFAFPSESTDFEFVSLLKQQYSVSTVPALVVENRVFGEIENLSELENILDCHPTAE